MALKHKVTAIKAQGRGDDMVLSLMTQSPRGTQVPFKSVEVKRGEKTKKEMKIALAVAVEKLLAGDTATI